MQNNRLIRLAARYMLPIYLLNTIFINPARGVILAVWTWDGWAFLIVLPLLFLVGLFGPIALTVLVKGLWQRLRAGRGKPGGPGGPTGPGGQGGATEGDAQREMGKSGSVLRSAIGLVTGRFCQPVFSFVLFWLCARTLSLEDFGIYVLLMGLVLIFQVMSTVGLGQLLPRELGRTLGSGAGEAAPGVLTGAAIALALPASAVCYALLYASALLVQGPGEAARCCLILGLALPFSCGILVAESAFVAYGAGRPLFVFNLAEQATRTGLSALALWLGYGLPGLMWAYVCGRAVACAVAFAYARRANTAVPRKPDRASLAALGRHLPIFAAMTVIATVCMRTDILVLSWLADPASLGIYGCAIRVVSICFIVPESISAAAYPRFSALWAARDAGLAGRVAESLGLSLGMTLLAAACLALFAPIGLTAIFGAKYAPSVPVLAVLGFMLPAYAVTVHLGLLLQAIEHERVVLGLVLAALVLLAVATALGMRAAGVMGVACAMVGALGLLACLYLRVSEKIALRLPRPVALQTTVRPIVRAGLVLAVCLIALVLVRPQGAPLYAGLTLGAGLSLGLSGLYRVLTPIGVRRALS